MKSMGDSLDFKRHKRYLIWFIITAASITLFLVMNTFHMIVRLTFNLWSTFTLMANFANTLLLTGAHLTISFLYLFLLINVKIRFRQLNKFMT